MKYSHKTTITVFVKPEDIAQDKDIVEKIKLRFKEMSQSDKPAITETISTGFEERIIKIFTLEIKESDKFLKFLKAKLGNEQLATLNSQIGSRLDENLDFFLRLSKPELLEGKYILTESGDCFHIKIAIAAYPKKMESAVRVAGEMFK
jgi:RNA binding exosome subunit